MGQLSHNHPEVRTGTSGQQTWCVSNLSANHLGELFCYKLLGLCGPGRVYCNSWSECCVDTSCRWRMIRYLLKSLLDTVTHRQSITLTQLYYQQHFERHFNFACERCDTRKKSNKMCGKCWKKKHREFLIVHWFFVGQNQKHCKSTGWL